MFQLTVQLHQNHLVLSEIEAPSSTSELLGDSSSSLINCNLDCYNSNFISCILLHFLLLCLFRLLKFLQLKTLLSVCMSACYYPQRVCIRDSDVQMCDGHSVNNYVMSTFPATLTFLEKRWLTLFSAHRRSSLSLLSLCLYTIHYNSSLYTSYL